MFLFPRPCHRVLAFAALLLLGACATSVEDREAALAKLNTITLDFSWEGTAACNETASPPFAVRNIPPSTQTLRFSMRNRADVLREYGSPADIPYADNGRGTAALSRGAFQYSGPCPLERVEVFEWHVLALDTTGKTLAGGIASRPFPP